MLAPFPQRAYNLEVESPRKAVCREEVLRVTEQNLRQPAALLVWLGGCGLRVLAWVPRAFAVLGRGTAAFFRDLRHGLGRVLRYFGRILIKPVQLRGDIARKAEKEWQSVSGESRGAKAFAAGKIAVRMLLSEHGILTSLFRYAVPVLCIAFLYSVVSYGAEMDYGIRVTFNGNSLGCIAEESDYRTAESIVRRRLSYTAEKCEITYSHAFRLEPVSEETELLTAAELADRMLYSSKIDLTEAYGVYLGEEFLGTVTDPEPIQRALHENLDRYYETLGPDVISIAYSEEVRFEKGSYLTENLVDAVQLAEKLTSEKEVLRTYTAAMYDSVYSAALRFSITPERVREVNPDVPDLLPQGKKLQMPVTEHYIPIVYQKAATSVSFIDYDTVRTETSRLPVGQERRTVKGVKGERENEVEITYTDGVETGRTLLSSTLISLPVDEEISVGIYSAKPASTLTKLYGTGQFAWPVNGGYISDVFISNRNHRGLDIAAPGGTEIFAAEDGTVRLAATHPSYGNYIIVDHENGFSTYYAHCSALLVTEGQEVTRGQIIGLVGTTGHSTGNHLHFEVRIDGINYNPADYLRVNTDD